jgi:hypothetical protein
MARIRRCLDMHLSQSEIPPQRNTVNLLDAAQSCRLQVMDSGLCVRGTMRANRKVAYGTSWENPAKKFDNGVPVEKSPKLQPGVGTQNQIWCSLATLNGYKDSALALVERLFLQHSFPSSPQSAFALTWLSNPANSQLCGSAPVMRPFCNFSAAICFSVVPVEPGAFLGGGSLISQDLPGRLTHPSSPCLGRPRALVNRSIPAHPSASLVQALTITCRGGDFRSSDILSSPLVALSA